MTIETIQKERLCELLPDYSEQVIIDLERIVQKLGELSVGSEAYQACLQEARENIDALVEEGLDREYITSVTPLPLLATSHLAAA